MEEILFYPVYIILNFIGGTLRWLFGTMISVLLKKQRFTFREYLWGSKNPDYYDKKGHHFNNVLIALFFIIAIVPFFSI